MDPRRATRAWMGIALVRHPCLVVIVVLKPSRRVAAVREHCDAVCDGAVYGGANPLAPLGDEAIVRDVLLPVLFRADGTVAEGVNVATWRMKVHVLAGAAQVL